MKQDDTIYIERPKGRPDVTTKGKLLEWNCGYKEFIPVGTRPSNRTMLKQIGGSSFYKTEGEKSSSWSLHLNVDAKDCDDPVAALYEQFRYLTAAEQKQRPQIDRSGEGRMLMDTERVKVWHDAANNRVEVMTTLDCTADLERQLLQAVGSINVIFGRYRQEILKR